MSERPTQRWLFQASDIWLGEFRCLPGNPAWTQRNRTGDEGPLIAFPRTAVRIAQEGRPEVYSDPTRAVLYPAGQPYRRGLVSGDGDRCSLIAMSRPVAAQAAAGLDPSADDPDTYRFPFPAAPVDGDDYLRHQALRRRVVHDGVDTDAVRESLYWLVSRVAAGGYRARDGRARGERPATIRSRIEVVDAVRATLGANPGARLSLDALARLVHQSPFHLSRMFRAQTGKSIHAYRTEIRLRVSLERLLDGQPLAAIAADLGFASQAHFTDRFKRLFGIAPHQWRAGLSRNLEASA